MEDARTSKRFPVHLSVKLQDDTGTNHELDGTADNVSAAGAYLVLNHGFDPGSTVSFEMMLPAETVGAAADVKVRCLGRVLRTDQIGPDKNGVACVIDSYEFVRPNETEV